MKTQTATADPHGSVAVLMPGRIVRSIAQIGRARWETCFPGALEGYDYLSAVEAAGLPGFAWFYVSVQDADGRLAAVAAGFVTPYALDTTLGPRVRRLIAAVRRPFPGALTLKLAALGSPCTEAAPLGLAPDLSPAQRRDAASFLSAAFEAEAVRAGCHLWAFKDIAQSDTGLWDPVLHARGYASAAGQPSACLDIDFADIDGYLARLSRATRKDLRRKMKSSAVRSELRSELAGVEQQVMALYEDTRARADQQFETLTADYFSGVLAAMPGRAFCMLYYEGENLLAANLMLRDGEVLLDKFFCMNSRSAASRDLYFISWLTNVQLCLSLGLRVYQSGQAGYETKLRLGSRLVPAQDYFRFRNRLLNRLVSWAGRRLWDEPSPGKAAS